MRNSSRVGVNAERVSDGRLRRAQANLPAFAIAVLVVTATASLAILVADGAFVSADRESIERTRATGLAATMVAAQSPLTERASVVNTTRASSLDDELENWFPAATGVALRVTLDDTVIAERGAPQEGTTVRRLVLVSDVQSRTIEPALSSSDQAVTLPRRATSARLVVTPPGGTTLSTVRVNDRVVLHDPAGLDGTYSVPLSRFETATIAFDASGPLPAGSVRVHYRPAATRKAVLAVTVDA